MLFRTLTRENSDDASKQLNSSGGMNNNSSSSNGGNSNNNSSSGGGKDKDKDKDQQRTVITLMGGRGYIKWHQAHLERSKTTQLTQITNNDAYLVIWDHKI